MVFWTIPLHLGPPPLAGEQSHRPFAPFVDMAMTRQPDGPGLSVETDPEGPIAGALDGPGGLHLLRLLSGGGQPRPCRRNSAPEPMRLHRPALPEPGGETTRTPEVMLRRDDGVPVRVRLRRPDGGMGDAVDRWPTLIRTDDARILL